ncbi:MAG TPA: isochorismate synthase [Candidatus Nanopelagicaceae bacterium]|nr:isochorismate synthase [Candidatus Nanopelagicaceae bacterium]
MTISALPIRIDVTTLAFETPEDLFSLLPSQSPLSWVRSGEGLVAYGEYARLEVSGPDRFSEASAWWRDQLRTFRTHDNVRESGTGPIAFGSFSFSESDTSVLIIPEVIIGRRGDKSWITTIGSPIMQTDAPYLTERNYTLTWGEGARSAVSWQGAVANAVRRIQSGALDKVVLARDVQAIASKPIDVRRLMAKLAENYPKTWIFAVDNLVGATPELLVRLTKGLVTSRVLAGTIRRSGDDERDLALAGSLARSSKDLEEHDYAVRSVADALAPFCSSMNVNEAPFVLHLANVMHLATDVNGVLADSLSTRDTLSLVQALHPTAAVCGTPTATARDLILEIEGLNRGRYAGPVGWIDATGDGEWGIALRCAEISEEDPRKIRLFAGCGIVAGSIPDEELAESQAKLLPMRDALEG